LNGKFPSGTFFAGHEAPNGFCFLPIYRTVQATISLFAQYDIHRKNQVRISVEEIFTDAEELSKYSLDVPQISLVAKQMIESGIPLSGNLWTVDGVEKALLDYLKGGDRK
jgi:hypothetical protein